MLYRLAGGYAQRGTVQTGGADLEIVGAVDDRRKTGAPGLGGSTCVVGRVNLTSRIIDNPNINTANDLPPALLVYFRLEESPSCSPAVLGAEPGALLELQYVPTPGWNGGEVELRVLHANEIPGTDRTGSSAQWFAIRSDNN